MRLAFVWEPSRSDLTSHIRTHAWMDVEGRVVVKVVEHRPSARYASFLYGCART